MDTSRDLPRDVRERVNNLDAVYMAAKSNGDAFGMEQALRDTWALYPEPKFGWSDSQLIVHDLIRHLRDHGKADEALALSDQQFESGSVLEHQSEPGMYRGSAMLAVGRVGDAREVLGDVLKRFGKRAFAGHDSQLLAFAETGEVPADIAANAPGDPNSEPATIPDAIHAEITQLSELGNERSLAGDQKGAINAWRQAIDLLPEPKLLWDAAAWLYGSIGDVLASAAVNSSKPEQIRRLLPGAREALVNALAAPTGETNPLIQMRRGQVEHLLGNPDQAHEHLLKAYMLDGETVFAGQDPLYLDILRVHGDLVERASYDAEPLQGFVFECRDLGLEIESPTLDQIRQQLDDALAGNHQLCAMRPTEGGTELLDCITDGGEDRFDAAVIIGNQRYTVQTLDRARLMSAFEKYGTEGIQAVLDELTVTGTETLDPS